jgi:hypothetical protein
MYGPYNLSHHYYLLSFTQDEVDTIIRGQWTFLAFMLKVDASQTG